MRFSSHAVIQISEQRERHEIDFVMKGITEETNMGWCIVVRIFTSTIFGSSSIILIAVILGE